MPAQSMVGCKRKANGSRHRNNNEDSDDDAMPLKKTPKINGKIPNPRLIELRKHTNANEFTARTEMVVDRLTKAHRVKRLSVQDFEQPDFEELVGRLDAATTAVEVEEVLARLHTAIFLEHGSVLDKLRVSLTTVAERADKMTRELEAAELEPRSGGYNDFYESNRLEVAKVTDVYRTMLKNWSAVLEGTRPSITILEQRYPKTSGLFRRTPAFTTWDKRIAWVCKDMTRARESIEGHYQYDVQSPTGQKPKETWQQRREFLGDPLTTLVVDLYRALCESYEATFAAAVKLAPSTFSHPGW
ncbi:hypothetical protein LTR17_023859 [Elasticomyces elasticus]|nr:hypothetical protein LTR17_023859 [Elasticomyces elasticus]